MGRRVLVTGVGVVSSIGTGVSAFWDGLADGVSGASVLELEGEPPTPVCRIPDFDGEALFGRRDARRMDRCAQLATAAAQLALEDAGGDLGLRTSASAPASARRTAASARSTRRTAPTSSGARTASAPS